MLLGILLAIHIIVCVCLIGVVLLQRSEGGALGMGGGPNGMMTARGAGDLLTRTTWILGTLFFILSLALTLLTGRQSGSGSVVDRIKIDNLDASKLAAPPSAQQQQQAPAQDPAAPAQPAAPTLQDLESSLTAAPAPAQPAPAE